MTTEQEVRKINLTLEKLLAEFQNIPERKRMIKKAAKPMVAEIKAQTPVSAKAHKRYAKQAKLIQSIRTPKGMGEVIEVIESGRLRDSIGFIPLRYSSAIFIGPKGLRKKIGAPYYAAWPEFGTIHMRKTPYMRPGFEMTKGIVLKNIEKEYTKKVTEFGAKHRV